MKKIFTTLVLVLGIFTSVFAQSQELNTIYATLIGPENVDSYYDDQIVYYQNEFEELKKEVTHMIHEEKSIEKKINRLDKIKGKDKRELKRVKEQLGLLEDDLNAIEKFSNLWNEFTANQFQAIKSFERNFLSGACYSIESNNILIPQNNFTLEVINLGEKIEWVEMTSGFANTEQLEVNSDLKALPGTKWVKRKADKNCLSADPNDCLVWCLVEITPEEKVANGYIEFRKSDIIEECPDEFEISFDQTFCTRKVSIEKSRSIEKKIAFKYKEYPYQEIIISNYSKIDCKN